MISGPTSDNKGTKAMKITSVPIKRMETETTIGIERVDVSIERREALRITGEMSIPTLTEITHHGVMDL